MVVHIDGAGNSAKPAPEPADPAETNLVTDQIKGAFLASLNHEFRTPLSGIVGMLDLLNETELTDEQREYVNAAQLCGESLAELLNATLRYSALEAGQCVLEETEFSPRHLLESSIAAHRSKAEEKNLKLFLTLDANLPEALAADAARIRELLGYLISNALKFTNKGSVEVRASVLPSADETGGETLEIEVADTGVGIPPEKLDGIFSSFRQGQDGLARNYPGLGLGLALARKLADLLNADLDVESTLGQGSTFTLRIPVLEAKADKTESRTWPLAKQAPRVLAVDDNPVGLRVLRHFLERHRIEVVTAASGEEAVEAVRQAHPDLVLMDLQMPGMDGLEATRTIRQFPECEALPIVALTANCSEHVRQLCLDHGMQAFLSKPVDSGELWRTVQRYCQQQQPAAP